MRGDEAHGFGRREFLAAAGVGALGLAGGSALGIAQQARTGAAAPGGAMSGAGATEDVKFPPIQKSTERQEEGPPNPQPPAGRVGYAVVGLGRLTLVR